MPRTQQEFDKWFAESGDPWNYNGSFVLDRLQKSLSFIQRYTDLEFDGIFIEIGAYNGAFSARLAEAFPRSLIIANDISEFAIQQARVSTSQYTNILFDRSDMMNFRMPETAKAHSRVLLLMETLYYLPQEERSDAIKHLVYAVQPTTIFVSGPIQGDNYFNERMLTEQFGANGFVLKGLLVLNGTEAFRDLPPKQQGDERFKEKSWRQKYGRQVMYRFRPSLWTRIRTILKKTERMPSGPSQVQTDGSA